MKKKSIIIVILGAVLAVTLIATSIQQYPQYQSEYRLEAVVNYFLNDYLVWDESKEIVCAPEYIEVSFNGEFFIKFPLADKYSMYYGTDNGDPEEFFIETPGSITDATHSEASTIISICKKLQYGTCFLKTETGTIKIEKIQIDGDGFMAACDINGEWYKNLSSLDFVLS